MQSICFLMLLLVELALGQLDIDALLELKKGIQEDPSKIVLGSWDSKSLASDGCPLNWFGVGCNEGHVTSITLDNVGLSGVFNFPALSGLKLLHNLSISNNQFSGTVAEEIGLVESLEYLDISQNSFSGSIPRHLTNLRKLVVLNLSVNNMEGTIPSGLASLKQLKYLDFHSNRFSGEIMGILAQLGSVAYVDFSNNQFSGSMDLEPGGDTFVSSIQYLNISHNNLTGELFPHDGMPFFDNLEVFDASNNHLIGNIPSFGFVVSLKVLRLGSNQLSGSLPEALLQESSMILTDLDISFNQLEGPTGSISSATLKNLNLSSNKLSGPLPATVGRCAVVDLSNNMLTGNISRIETWGNYIEVVDLSSNKLMGTFPIQTSQFLRLTSLKVSNNSLEGDLPPALSKYPELRVLDMSLNQLSGFLPHDLLNSTIFTDINISFNNLIGNITIEAVTTQNLTLVTLDLSHNALSGHLPPALGELRNLVLLDLSNNHLEGQIPDNLPDKLRDFNVSYNNLSGNVPEKLWRYPDSAFHPGNSLLIFPLDSSSTKSNPGLEKRGSHMKSSVRVALIISGLVISVSLLAFLALLICCKFRHSEAKILTSKERGAKKDNYSLSQIESAHGPSFTSETAEMPKDLRQREIDTKIDVVSPCMPIIPSANTSPSGVEQQLAQNSGPLKVCSPDKLAGDLHLFDSSLRFTAEELSCAPAEVIGTSCHGTLYKVVIGPGHVLAVRWLKEGIAKGRKEFAREARKLASIRHPNLVSFQGFYWGPKDHEKLIISSYINAPCLTLYFYDPRKLPPLSLNERLKIAVDIACCLSYLHNESAIPHGNLKSSNILIESPNLNVLLTDYSLHRIMTSAGTAEQVLNAGALGYRPPEFASTSKPCPSLKSDVYAFGVILLELLTGRNSMDMFPGEQELMDLTEWVIHMFSEDRSIDCFDQLLLGTEKTEDVIRTLDNTLRVALRCILPAGERPDMKMICEDLSVILSECTADR